MKISTEFLTKFEEQLCIDFNCTITELHQKKNIITPLASGENRRRNFTHEPMLRIISYYEKILVNCDDKLLNWAKTRYENEFSGWIFRSQNLHQIDFELQKYGECIYDIHHYFLPLESFPQKKTPGNLFSHVHTHIKPDFPVKWFEADEMEQFRGQPYPEAVAFHPLNPDVLAVAAMDGDKIMGIAGASEDTTELWQIGITVNEKYRGRGIAVQLVTLLKDEIIRRGKVPFYGTVESHNLSNSVAIKSGFFPVWSELTSGPV